MLKKNHIFGYIEKTYLIQACYPNFFEASNHIEKENTIIWSIVKMYTGTPLEPTLCPGEPYFGSSNDLCFY